MFGHKSAPARFYAYGILPPTEGAEVVDQQMRQAHRYKNALIHHELIRRRKVERTLLRLSPELVKADAELEALEAAILAAEATLKQSHIENRARTLAPALTAPIKDLKAKRKDAYQRRKVLRKTLFASAAWKEAQEAIEAWADVAAKRLRSVSGLYWGTYLHVENSMADRRRGAPPRFSRWDGDGHIAVQIQKGMLPSEAFGCQDNRVRIEPVPAEAWEKGGRRLRRTRIHVRVGSGKKGTPVWAVFPMILHRPMPADALIKWVHVTRRRIATHFKWDVQIVLARDLGWDRPDRATTGRVGVDVGWRMRPDGSLRTAYWVDDDGKEGEVLLPPEWVQGMKKVRDIQSIRDKMRDGITAVLSAGLKGLSGMPPEIARVAEFAHLMKSIPKLSALVDRWRNELRFSGDSEIFGKAEAWRKRDKHLWEYEENLRDRLQRRRHDLYRVFAAHLRRTYKTISIERLTLKDFHELPEVEYPMPLAQVKEHVRDACLSTLLGAIKANGGGVEPQPPEFTTLRHATCGSIEEMDKAKLFHTCSRCGERYDQDRNAAVNLLGMASAPVATPSV